MNTICLLDQTKCPYGVDPFYETSTFLPWFELVALFALLFAAMEFMSNRPFRAHLFKTSKYPKRIIFSTIFSLLLVIFSHFLPLIGTVLVDTKLGDLFVSIGNNLDTLTNDLFGNNAFTVLLAYPATWELVALIIFSVIVVFLFAISISEKCRERVLIPSYNGKNSDRLIQLLDKILISDELELQKGSTKILLHNNNLEKLLRNLTERKEFNEMTAEERNVWCLFNGTLTNKAFIGIITHRDSSVLFRVFNVISKTRALDCTSFVQVISRELLLSRNSLLSKELDYYGEGFIKHLFNSIFGDPHIYNNFNLFFGLNPLAKSNLKGDTISKCILGVNISLKSFFSREENQEKYLNINTISGGLNHLSGISSTLGRECRKYSDSEMYSTRQSHQFYQLFQFAEEDIANLLKNISSEKLSSNESEMDKSVSRKIASFLFKLLDSLTILDAQEFARLQALDLPLLENLRNSASGHVKRIQKELKTLLEERIKKNMNGRCSSMIRLLIALGGLENEKRFIGKLLSPHKDKLIKLMKNRKTRDYYCPSDWKIRKNCFVDKNGFERLKIS